jgi:uncharacterized protein
MRPQAPALAPVAESERIHALDVIRGIALLGILFVNIQIFGETFGTYVAQKPESAQGLAGAISYYWVALFCEGRFYTIFSMLFGVGLALQWTRAVSRGRGYAWYGMRRLFTLMVIGLCHGLFIWFGDILFVYSIVGLITLPLLKARPRTLLIVAACVFIVGTLLGSAVEAYLMQVPPPPDPSKIPIRDPAIPPFQQLWSELSKGSVTQGPDDPFWIATETEAMRHGPFLQATLFRLLTFCMICVITLLGYGWTIWAMFLTGVAFLKLNVFTRERASWHRRLCAIGLGVGLPLVVAHSVINARAGSWSEHFVAAVLHVVGTVAMSFGYLGLFLVFAHSAAVPALKNAIARVGRMGLTNYLLESAIATGIFYHWGLGLFGETTRWQRTLLVLGIYAVLMALSTLWLKHFRYGPMEWLWRACTYLRLPAMRRTSAAGTEVAEA